jgi:L-lactate dehydrogenase complex protein LldF
MAGEKFAEKADLPKACSVCGACNEVCPVNIPLPDLLLRLRDKAKQEGAALASAGTPPMGAWALMATKPFAWKSVLTLGKMMDYVPEKIVPVPAFQAWTKDRTLPPWQGGEFRKWFKNRPQPKTMSDRRASS